MNSENYSPFEVLTENFGSSETAWEDFSYQISSMPLSIQDLILGVSAEDFIFDLAKELDLSAYQTKNLASIVGNVLMGELFISDAPDALSEKLSVDPVTAQHIQERIMGELFASASEDIRKIQKEKFPDRIGQGNAPVQHSQPTQSMPVPPPPPQMKNAPPVNQSNVIDLRNQS